MSSLVKDCFMRFRICTHGNLTLDRQHRVIELLKYCINSYSILIIICLNLHNRNFSYFRLGWNMYMKYYLQMVLEYNDIIEIKVDLTLKHYENHELQIIIRNIRKRPCKDDVCVYLCIRVKYKYTSKTSSTFICLILGAKKTTRHLNFEF